MQPRCHRARSGDDPAVADRWSGGLGANRLDPVTPVALDSAVPDEGDPLPGLQQPIAVDFYRRNVDEQDLATVCPHALGIQRSA